MSTEKLRLLQFFKKRGGITLFHIIHNLSVKLIPSKDFDITGIATDSRLVKPGNIFVAIQGLESDGHRYIEEAIKKGAAAVVCDKPVSIESVQKIFVRDSREALAQIAANFYESPADRLKLIGITGTNGKSTTAYLVNSILEKAGYKTGLIGTIHYKINTQIQTAKHTTPDALELNELFSSMIRHGVQWVTSEVSSHAVALKRIFGLFFEIGVFTNLTQDHLDFHRSIEDYRETKLDFFRNHIKPDGTIVVNMDDPEMASRILAISSKRFLRYSLNQPADIYPLDILSEAAGLKIQLQTPLGSLKIQSTLLGEFNGHNIMAAVGAGLAAGLDLKTIQAGIEKLKGVPGRFEQINQGQSFTVVVDYAHTPDALERTLKSARQLCRHKLWVVFGCGGNRDRGKRPQMGRIATTLADGVIITTDNPRLEKPQDIIQEIQAGTKPDTLCLVIEDRIQAIREVVKRAEPNDFIVIAGKGHENYQEIGRNRIPFDDREEVERCLQEYPLTRER